MEKPGAVQRSSQATLKRTKKETRGAPPFSARGHYPLASSLALSIPSSIPSPLTLGLHSCIAKLPSHPPCPSHAVLIIVGSNGCHETSLTADATFLCARVEVDAGGGGAEGSLYAPVVWLMSPRVSRRSRTWVMRPSRDQIWWGEGGSVGGKEGEGEGGRTDVDLSVGGARVDVALVGGGGGGEVAADEGAEDAVAAVGHDRDIVRVHEVR